jgi:signal transduction histidine kinase
MYGEMLREGWASEDKKQEYYSYIHDESERLSRLIGNVLQLARMTRNDLHLQLKSSSVAELLDGIASKISSQVERAGFTLNCECDESAGARQILVDPDGFAQIFINLVDNAIKFSAKAKERRIDIACRFERGAEVVFTVRDYGPGVAPDQMKKIFRLFYRSENELTRETVGTGIGLALVRQLADAMDAKVDVVSRDPGAEFRITFGAA